MLARLKIDRPVLVGHSWGTLVALSLAESCDPRGLLLLSGYYFADRKAGHELAAPLALPLIGDLARGMVPEIINQAAAYGAFRHVFRPQAVPARFLSRFPRQIALADEQLRASAKDTATINEAARALQPGLARLKGR